MNAVLWGVLAAIVAIRSALFRGSPLAGPDGFVRMGCAQTPADFAHGLAWSLSLVALCAGWLLWASRDAGGRQ